MTKINNKEHPPIDRGWAWMIVLGVFLQVFCFMGIMKSMGLISLELVSYFEITAAEAFLPAGAVFITYTLTSPIALIMGEVFSIRKVVIFGSVCGFAGMCLGSLLYNITYFTILFGVGTGICAACYLGNGLLLLSRYFRRRRSLANGIALSGASVGQFVMPPLIEILLETYGLGGTLLIAGAIFLHGVVAGALFRPIGNIEDDAELLRRAQEDDETCQEASGSEGEKQISDEPLKKNSRDDLQDLGTYPNLRQKVEIDASTTPSYVKVKPESVLKISEDPSKDKTTSFHQVPRASKLHRNTRKSIGDDSRRISLRMSAADVECPKTENEDAERIPSKPIGLMKRFKAALNFKALKNHIVFLYTVVLLTCFFGYINAILFFPAIFQDRGLDSFTSATLISISAVGDLISRLGVGFLADFNFVARYKLMGASCCLCGANIFMLSFADTFVWAAVHSFLYGLTGGPLPSLHAVVLVDFVGLAKLPSSLAIASFIQGFGLAFGQPLLGALRDYTGSSDVIAYICGATMSFGAILLFTYPLARELEHRRQMRKSEVSVSKTNGQDS